MQKVILVLFIACFICACGQKGPLVPPEPMVSGGDLPEITETFSS